MLQPPLPRHDRSSSCPPAPPCPSLENIRQSCASGAGGQELLRSCRGKGGWSKPHGYDGINTAESEYDATPIDGGRFVIFTRSPNPDEGGTLFLATRGRDGTYRSERLPDAINSPSGWNFGPSVSASKPGVLFYSSHWEGNTRGRADIYTVRYRVK